MRPKNELRFYAGALLLLPDQRPLGTCCIIDRQPRTFTADKQRALDHMAPLSQYFWWQVTAPVCNEAAPGDKI